MADDEDHERNGTIEAPPLWMTALESRAVLERASMVVGAPLRRLLPRGDGHHVIVLPGFTADDRSTRPLRHLLRDLGYHSHGWRLGLNLGPTPAILDGIGKLLPRIYEEGNGPVSLVGWSLGGIFARELARASPLMVRQVITLGSPIQMIEDDSSSVQLLWNALRPLHSPDFKPSVRAAFRPLLKLPATSIYSRTDGIVAWQAALIHRTDMSENIRVHGSHGGLGFNNAVIYAVADRLAQPADDWRHFKAPRFLRGAYPAPQNLDVSRLPGAPVTGH